MARRRCQKLETMDQEWMHSLSTRETSRLAANTSIISAPVRHVRIAKRNGDSVQPKSRLTIPGHLDPHFRTNRPDAPRTSWVAVQTAVTIAVSLNMFWETLDVSAGFLSGMPIDRSSHIQAPSCGLPSVGECPDIQPGKLLRILKGACGMTEAPRLWCLRARERLVGLVASTELRFSRVVFAKHDAGGKQKVRVTMRVDDGLLFETRMARKTNDQYSV